MPISMIRVFAFSILLLMMPFAASSTEVFNSAYGYAIYPPSRWTLLDDSESAAISFSDSSKKAVAQIFVLDGEQYIDNESIAQFIAERFNAKSENAQFEHRGNNVILSNLEFRAGRNSVRGYGLYQIHQKKAFVTLVFAPENEYHFYEDDILSTLNTFSASIFDKVAPGPISDFIGTLDGGNESSLELEIEGEAIQIAINDLEIAGAQQIIAREARIVDRMQRSDPLFTQAIERYYRLVYRDNHHRLQELASAIEAVDQEKFSKRDRLPFTLASWLRSFNYSPLDRSIEFSAPVSSLIAREGEAASLSLLYVSLLRHLGYRAILITSSRSNRIWAGVDIEDTPNNRANSGVTGAQPTYFNFKGRRYTVIDLSNAEDGIILWRPIGADDDLVGIELDR